MSTTSEPDRGPLALSTGSPPWSLHRIAVAAVLSVALAVGAAAALSGLSDSASGQTGFPGGGPRGVVPGLGFGGGGFTGPGGQGQPVPGHGQAVPGMGRGVPGNGQTAAGQGQRQPT